MRVQLLYNVVLVSAVQKSESARHIHISPTFWISFPCRSGFPGSSAGRESFCNVGDLGSVPGLEDLLEKEQLPTLVFLPGEFHRQRNLVGYSPWG